jgi:hypothetical protein
MSITDKVEEFKDKAREKMVRGKEKVYKTAANISDRIEKKQGRIGQVATVLDEVAEAGKRIISSPEAQRGADAVKKGFGMIKEKSANLYDRFREEVIKEGTLDIEGAERLLKKGAAATERFGSKAINSLAEIVRKAHAGLRTDYQNIIPSKEEIAAKYSDIGTDYQGVLLRKNFEGCRAFYEAARKKLPGRLKTRPEVLKYIKASASSNENELSEYCEKKYYEVRREKGEKAPETIFAYSTYNAAAKYLVLKRKE